MAPQPTFTYQRYVGVDIAATSFTAAFSDAPSRPASIPSYDQTPDGYAAFLTALQASTVPPTQTLIVMEATGSYWMRLAVFLHAAGFVVSVVNPKQVRHFLESLPRRSKTDQLDAELLLRFALERKPAPWTPPPDVYHQLRQLLLVRDSLVEMRQQARNQLHALAQWPVAVPGASQHLEQLVATCDAELLAIEAEIATALKAGAWAASAAVLLSIPGIGILSAAWILVSTQAFSRCATPAAATAYAGLDPLQHESGSSVRQKAHIGRGGHARLRKALYMATLSAARCNPLIKTFYARLRESGKPMKVARCAAARKLLHLAWAVVTKQQAFDASYGAR